MYYVPDGTKECGYYECKKCGNRFLSLQTMEKIPCPECEAEIDYEIGPDESLDDILDFHVRFERIHPFQDGNGRVGRLIMFKECLKYNIVPFIIEENLKLFYYRSLKEWYNEKGYLTDTCLTAQDKYKAYLDYFRIPYEK